MSDKQLIILLCYQFGKILNKIQCDNSLLTDKILALTFCLQSFIKYANSCQGWYWLWSNVAGRYHGEQEVSYYDDQWANKINENGIDRAVRYLTHYWLIFECKQRLNKSANINKNEQEVSLEKEQNKVARLGALYLYFSSSSSSSYLD